MSANSKVSFQKVGRFKAAVLAALCILAAALLLNRLKPAAAAATPRIVERQILNDDWKPRGNVIWPVELRRDLFAAKAAVPVVETAPSVEPPKAPTQPSPEDITRNARTKFRVGGILYSKKPKTLLNGALCVEGDVVDGYRVHRIERNAIVVEKNGVLVTILP